MKISINRYISKQFANPKGIGGRVISLVMNRQNRPLYNETIHLLSVSDTDSVLDIGCGNGFAMKLLANKHKAFLAGIDPSDEIIKVALRHNRKYIDKDIMAFSCQNVNAMSFTDESFTKTYTINTVYFWDKLSVPMREIWRILKPGGVFINTFYTSETLARFPHTQFGYKRYHESELTKAGIDASFSVTFISVLQGAALCAVYNKPKMGVQ